MTADSDYVEHPDYLILSRAPMSTLVAALRDATSGGGDNPTVPPATAQIADLIVSRAVRMIRLGTPGETLTAAQELTRGLMDPLGSSLRTRDPEAFEAVGAAEIVLSAAYSPSSAAAEVSVLRSWNGRARDVVSLLASRDDTTMSRAELRSHLGLIDESHLSHILGDLESAGLVRRSRVGREVNVHLGPSAHSEPVQEMLRAGQSDWRNVVKALERVLDGDDDRDDPLISALDPIRDYVDQVRNGSDDGPGIEGATAELDRYRFFGDSMILLVRIDGYQLPGALKSERNTKVTETAIWELRLHRGRISNVDRWSLPNSKVPRPTIRPQRKSEGIGWKIYGPGNTHTGPSETVVPDAITELPWNSGDVVRETLEHTISYFRLASDLATEYAEPQFDQVDHSELDELDSDLTTNT